MVMTTTVQKQIEQVVKMALEDEDFGTFLERFDLTPEEVFLHLYEAGMINPDTFEDFLVND